MSVDAPLPPYSYVPGGPWPHPIRSPDGHQAGHRPAPAEPIGDGEGWRESANYLRGLALFDAGYYWEAHEVWEGLWHAHDRRGPTADVLKALIKLAAAGVKVREGQPRGVATHARRAAALLQATAADAGRWRLGLDLERLAADAHRLAAEPPQDDAPPGAAVSRVIPFELTPRG